MTAVVACAATLSATVAVALRTDTRAAVHLAADECPATSAATALPSGLSYVVPPGFLDGSSTQPLAELTAPVTGAPMAFLQFFVNTPATNVSGLARTTVAGLPAYVTAFVTRTGVNANYVKSLVLVCGSDTQYGVKCSMLPGFDPTNLAAACDAFIGSLQFTPPVTTTGRACPSIPAPPGSSRVITCTVPQGYAVDEVVQAPHGSPGIILSAPSATDVRERIVLNWNAPSIRFPSSGLRRITVNGCPAYVQADTTSAATYLKQVALECDNTGEYSVQCRGYAGYDAATATQGCAAFIASLKLVLAPPPPVARTPAGTVPFSPVGMPIGAAVILGAWGWVIIRILAWTWPRLRPMREAQMSAIRSGSCLGWVLVVIFVSGALSVITNLAVARDLVLVFWPIAVVSCGLEIAWRVARRWWRPARAAT